MTTNTNGTLKLLLAGRPQQVQRWAAQLALHEEISTTTAVATDSFERRLSQMEAALLDGALYAQPRALLKALHRSDVGGNIYVILPPQATQDKVAKMQTTLEKLSFVQGVYGADVDLSALIPKIRANLPRQKTAAHHDSVQAPQGPTVVGVWNGAGGVGKTTVGTNLAFQLAQRGAKTFFVNLDAPDDASLMLGLKAEPNISHWRADPRKETLHQSLQSLGKLDVLAGFRDVFAQSEAIETPADQPGSVRQLVEQAQQRYDVVVLDTPQSPIAAHVLAVANQLVLVARSGMADAHRTAVAYRTVVDRMSHTMASDAVHVVINRLQTGHRLDAERWRKAASASLGRTFPPVVAQIRDDVRIGDAQDRRKVPVAEIESLQDSLEPLIAALVPHLGGPNGGRSFQLGPIEVVR